MRDTHVSMRALEMRMGVAMVGGNDVRGFGWIVTMKTYEYLH